MPSHANERLNGTEPSGSIDARETEREIVTFVRETVEEAGADGVVACLSGGTDSTVSATLAVEALHRHHVYSLVLPADPTRQTNLEDAKTVADDLGIDHRVVDVQPSDVARYADMVKRSEHKRIPPLTPTDRAFLVGQGGC